MMITENRLAELKTLLAEGKEHKFYLWAEWLKTAREVKKLDRNECQYCRAEGKSGAKHRVLIVHHVKHLRDRPDLALDIYDPDTGERQLVTTCKRHHEIQHPESFRQTAVKEMQEISPEYWD